MCKPTRNCKLSGVPSIKSQPVLILRRIPSPTAVNSSTLGTALSIGNFDGVHRGHRCMLLQLQQAARERNLQSSALTFAPHPREYFASLSHRPELTPTHITGLRDKVAAMRACGVDQVVIAKFNRNMADMSATAFVQELLVKQLGVRWLLVGEDFRFGHKRSGDLALLRDLGRQHGIEVHAQADVTDNKGHRISSSEVRAALALGDLIRAEHLLGRRFTMSGHVVHGQKLGRTLGFPTLNLRVTPRCAARSGIYVVAVHGLAVKPMPGIASLGVRPTVLDNGKILLEAHILDASTDAYGKLVTVEFLQHVRDEEKFPDLPTLTAAMDADRQHARKYFSLHGL